MQTRSVAVLLVLLIAATSSAQQTIYWKKDHVYAGPGGPEIAIITPPTTDTTAPSAPTLNTPTTHLTSVDLTWSASTDTGGSGLAGYKVYRRIGTGVNLPVGTVGPGTLSFTDQPLKPNLTYTYTIVAFDKAQNHSAASNSNNVLTSTDTTPPSAPAGMAIAYTSSTSVSMTWTASTDTGGSGLQGYRVYRDGALASALVPTTTRMYLDSTLAANAAYTYTVTAVDNVGNESTGISRSVFRDDFNRASGTALNSPYWFTSGTWVINSNQAAQSSTASTGYDALSTKSFGSVSASVKTVQRFQFSGTSPSSGLVFWSNDADTEKYVVNSTAAGGLALQYITPSQTYTLQASAPVTPPYLLNVDADATSRVIKLSVNGLLQFSYTETDFSRRNSGRVGMRGILTNTNDIVKTDEFLVVEKGGSLTSTDIVPPNLRLTYLSGTSVQVDWDASADIGNGLAGYEVYQGTTKVSGATLLSSPTFQNTGLTANTAYTYTAKAVDSSGTRYASLTKGVFRDDFNRTSAFLANAGWSSAGNWVVSGNTALATSFYQSDALTAASYGNFRATVTLSPTGDTYGTGVAGVTFWSNGTEGYRIDASGLTYYTSGGSQLLAYPYVTSGTIRVEANTTNRTINVYQNNVLILSYVETDTSRRNTGKAGVTGYVWWNPDFTEYCLEIGCSYAAIADDFIVEEQ